MSDSSNTSLVDLRNNEITRLSRLAESPHNHGNDDWGVLLSDRIRHYCDEFDLVSPFDPDSLRPAGYDLRVGYNYSVLGEWKSLNEGMHFEIGPYQVAIIETYESLNLPRFLIGRWNVRVQLAYKGLLWVGGAQVDPGFRGRLCCPIYNLSTEPVRLNFKQQLAMIDFVTTTRFKLGCKEFEWQGRKMLAFPDYPTLNSGIEKQVGSFQEQITNNLKATSKDTASIRDQTTKSLQEIGTRIDTFVVLTFTVVAVLFAGVGIVATKSSEPSFVAASFSLVAIAAIALYFALRPYYLMCKVQKRLPAGSDSSNADSFNHVQSLLKVGWTEGTLAVLLILGSVTLDWWSVRHVRGSADNAKQAKTLSDQAVQKANENRVEMERKLTEVHERHDRKIEDLEREIQFLQRTKKDK